MELSDVKAVDFKRIQAVDRAAEVKKLEAEGWTLAITTPQNVGFFYRASESEAARRKAMAEAADQAVRDAMDARKTPRSLAGAGERGSGPGEYVESMR